MRISRFHNRETALNQCAVMVGDATEAEILDDEDPSKTSKMPSNAVDKFEFEDGLLLL